MGIYRLRKRWQQLMQALDREEHWGKFVFVRFFDWYAPFFAAYSFVLARANEYEADRCAAQATDPRHIADALIAAHIRPAFSASATGGIYTRRPTACRSQCVAGFDMGRLMRRDIVVDDAQRRWRRA
jgi:Zn-dependent protease with chaperone function